MNLLKNIWPNDGACLFIYTHIVNFSDALNCRFNGCLIMVWAFVLVDIHMFTEMYKIAVSKDPFKVCKYL